MGPGRTGKPSKLVPEEPGAMMDFSRNHMTSFRMRCALTILILALAEFSMEAGSAKPMLVQVWCGGDDGLTLRLRDAVENAFKSILCVRTEQRKEARNINRDHHTNVIWKQVGTRTQVLYAVEFISINSQTLGTGAGSCWDDALAKCATKSLSRRTAPRTSSATTSFCAPRSLHPTTRC